MSDSAIAAIIGALIGAIGPIIVALINKSPSDKSRQLGDSIIVLPDGVNISPPLKPIARKPVLWVFIFTLLGGFSGYLLGAIIANGSRSPVTPTAAPTQTPVPPTLTITVIPTSISTSTSTSTPTSTPTPACLLYQRDTDLETMTNLIMAEAKAVNTGGEEGVAIIKAIFDPNAIIQDKDETPEKWNDPIDRYRQLFNTDYRNARHFDIRLAGLGITQTDAWFTSASSGEYNWDGTWRTYSNPAGSDHWTFSKNSFNCWVIIHFDFNARHVQFP
jgi:hypothetical protein